jgi:hypothetical protein
MLREFYDCQSIANPMTKEFTPLRPCAAQRMICKRLSNDKTAQTAINNLGNRKKVRP